MQLWTEKVGSVRQGDGEDISCGLSHHQGPWGEHPLWSHQASHAMDANRHLIVVMGRREEGKRQATKYSNSKGLCLRRWCKWSASDNSGRYAQGETGKKYSPERTLRKLQDEKEVKPCMEKAPCRTGRMKMGRRLVMVYKVITCLLLSNTAFPRILLGISRLHVHGWSWGLTSCALSGWKLSTELTAGWSQASRLSQPKLSSFAAKPCLDYLSLSAGKLPPTYCRALLAQPGWVAEFSFGLFWGFFADSFTRNVRTLIYSSRHIQFRGKGQLAYVLTVQWVACQTKQHRI